MFATSALIGLPAHQSLSVTFGPGYTLQVLIPLRYIPGFTLLSLTQIFLNLNL